MREAQLITCIAYLSMTTYANAQAFTRLVTFGDSLSDVGNVASQTFGISPGSSYYNNRYSNGPLWVDRLSSRLNLGASINSRASGYNYATGGTRSGTGYVSPVFFVNLPNAGQQLTDYLAARTPGADELFSIWTGGNDFLDGQTNPAIPADNVQALLNRLASAGARSIVVSNLPPLGETPRYNATADRATMNARAAQFNAALATRLDAFAIANPSVSLFRVDVAGFFRGLLADPASYGFTNTTGRAMTNGVVAPNPDQYVFYDDVHPTRVAHALLGEVSLDAVTTRRFIGNASAIDNWSIASNWSAARVPDSTSIVRFDSNAARVSSPKSVRRLDLPAGGRLTLEVGASGGSLAISETARLSGEIGIDFLGSSIGLPGESFPLFTFASATGTPTLINDTGFAGLDLVPLQDASSLRVQLSATAGDADLDDTVDFDDLLTLAQHYDTSGRNWLAGDFNADSVVGFDDLLLLAQNYTPGGLNNPAFVADWYYARSLVPEPACLTFASVACSTRRRRRG